MESKTQTTESTTYQNALILDCTSSSPHDNAGCDVAIIELTGELISLVERRFHLLQTVQSRDKGLCTMQFYDCAPDFFSLGDVLEEIYDSDVFQDESRMFKRTISVPAALRKPVGVAWMEFDLSECCWHAIPGDDYVQISTCGLTVSEVRSYMRQVTSCSAVGIANDSRRHDEV